jgi:hypothetical protein
MMIDLSLICGVDVGFELFDDDEDNSTNIVLNLLIVRIVISW